MKIDGTGNLARELRQLAGDVAARQQLEESDLDRERLSHLGELLLIAADMAADIDGEPPSRPMPAAVTDEWFADIVYRECPDGVRSDPTPGPERSQ